MIVDWKSFTAAIYKKTIWDSLESVWYACLYNQSDYHQKLEPNHFQITVMIISELVWKDKVGTQKIYILQRLPLNLGSDTRG